jgi:hypothetical protein
MKKKTVEWFALVGPHGKSGKTHVFDVGSRDYLRRLKKTGQCPPDTKTPLGQLEERAPFENAYTECKIVKVKLTFET